MIDEGAWIRWALLAARSERDLDAILLDTGIDAVDSDHRVLLRYAIDLNLQLDASALKGIDEGMLEAQAGLIEQLMSYTVYHFDREEVLVERLHAPGLERQRREHRRIVGDLQRFSAEFAAGRTSVPTDLRGSIFAWIVDHIADSDRETFEIKGLAPSLAEARSWNDLADIVRTTGIDELDLEHRQIVEDIIAAAHDLREGKPGDCLPSLIALRDSTTRHFAHEEELLDLHAAKNTALQRRLHKEFVATLDRTMNACEKEGEIGGDQGLKGVALGLLCWLTEHIGQVDYDSFRRGNWIATAMESARESSELYPLIRKTGIAAIDEDHQHFIDLSFRTLAATGASGRKAQSEVHTLEQAIEGLAGFAKGHFEREDSILRSADSGIAPRLIMRHREEHRNLALAFAELRADASGGRLDVSSGLRNKLAAWWVTHTNGTDIETFGSAVGKEGVVNA
jgi:hemerythrin-like metal-binding protein